MKKIIFVILLLLNIQYTFAATDPNDIDGDWIPNSEDPDIDWDWLSNIEENTWWYVTYDVWTDASFLVKSDPYKRDTDWDWLNDFKEKEKWTDPRFKDTDGDWVSDLIDRQVTWALYVSRVDKLWFYIKEEQKTLELNDTTPDRIERNQYEWAELDSEITYDENEWVEEFDLNIKPNTEWSWEEWSLKNDRLKSILWDNNVGWNSRFFTTKIFWQQWAYNLIITIAKEIKNIVVVILTILLFISILRLIFSSNTEDEVTKLKNSILWSWLWVTLMQVSYTAAIYLYWVSITWEKAVNFTTKIIQPFIDLLSMSAWFLFVWVWILSFYKLVASWWDESKQEEAKKWVIFSILWIIAIKVSWALVEAFYWKISCVNWTSCKNPPELSKWIQLITDIINWANSFILIIVTVLIIYTWYLLIFSLWDEEKVTKWKKFIWYILVWLALIAWSYIALTFIVWDWKWAF